MGMDIYGRNSTCKAGKYVRYAAGSWTPVADYILDNTPKKITKKCKHWFTNDYDGLDAADCVLLTDILKAQIKDGTTAAYIEQYNAHIESLPKKKREYYTKLSIESLQRFLDFLDNCGGFYIA